MPNYKELSERVSKQILQDNQTGQFVKVAFDEINTLRRQPETDKQAVWNTPFIRDINKIMHCPYFSRYSDKTQVYSLFKNDDMTRRSLHVQFVSRISRTIGRALHLNLDLIEAIALGHDMGHPAFAHTGERLLDILYQEHTGRRFLHNVHSVRVLDKIHPYNLTLQVLDGIASHNGELELSEYHPVPIKDFAEFDDRMVRCVLDREYADKIMPSTLEGAVVRISDIIAYLGKDRQDAILAKAVEEKDFSATEIGSVNAEIINNLIVNIIENSYAKPYIKLDDEHFRALKEAKKENYEKIYDHATAHTGIADVIEPMMRGIYGQLLDDLKQGCKTSPVFTHHIRQVDEMKAVRQSPYLQTEPNQLIVDYIASMTDDYFIELHAFLFPESAHKVVYRGYFDEENKK